MKTGWLLVLAATGLFVLNCRGDTAPPLGTALPIPPQQTAPWTPPATQLPPGVVSACQALFDAGLADPRGCEYREIVVPLRDEQRYPPVANPDDFKTHGWVLPAQAGESQRYAVCWNGLVYPLVSIGAPADLDGDIKKILAQNVDPGEDGMRKDPSTPSPAESLAVDQFTLIKLPLLLRLGRGDLAEGIWKHLQAWIMASRWNEDDLKLADPFIILSDEWIRAIFERALDAHVRNDPKLALACFQSIRETQKKVTETTDARATALDKIYHHYQPNRWWADAKDPDQIPALIAEEKRRIAENVTNRDEEFAPEKIADKKQRIALLVRDLEDVEAYQMMRPGYVEFGPNKVVMDLVKEGEDAVDPLLDCLAHDHRLTRSVDTGVRVIGVEEPAFAALQGIFKSGAQFPYPDEPYMNGHPGTAWLERTALAAHIRAYWNKVRGKSQPERWYATLLDDKATPEAWAEAADNIVLPGDADLFSGFGVGMMGHSDGTTVPLWGEPLRGKTNPTVSELLIKRLKECLAAKDPKPPFPYESPSKFAVALAKWDGKNQLETLRWYCGELQKIFAKQSVNEGTGQVSDLIKTYLTRHELGDTQALNEYARWLRGADAQKLDRFSQGGGAFFLAPVWSYPDDPAMVSLAHWLFEDPKSPWTTGPGGVDPDWIVASAHTPLEAIPAFRTLILRDLRNEKVVGSVEVTASNIMVQYHYGSGLSNDDPDAVVGTKQPLRMCDYIASRISEYQGAPRFAPYWPESRRDSAIEKTIAFLKVYGNQLFYKSTPEDITDYPISGEIPHFPALDHPATNEDALAGRAIFSLEGQGQRRVVKLDHYPFRANWLRLKDRRVKREEGNADGTTSVDIVYPQEGLIWQAEEVLAGGKWQRFYGYAGCGHIAQVPGDEIEFDPADGFDPMGNSWGFSVNLNGDADFSWGRPVPQIKPGQPVPVTIGIKNLRGNDRPLPAGAPAAGTILVQDAGIKLTVSFTPHPRKDTFAIPPNPAVQWKALVPKSPVRVDVLAMPSALAPLDGKPYLRFDLAKSYDFSAPGTYQVEFQFIKKSPFASEYGHLPMDFEVTAGE